MKPKLLWLKATTATKLGAIPVSYVGETREESYASCKGCPLDPTREDADSGDNCYSHPGTPGMAHSSMARKIKRWKDAGKYAEVLTHYTIDRALAGRSWSAKYVRNVMLGDSARCDPKEVRSAHDKVREEELGWLSYTHFPFLVARRGDQDLYCASLPVKGLKMGLFAQADYVIDALGFSRATVTLPSGWLNENGATFTTPAGKQGVVCYEQMATALGKRPLTCNNCGLCDPKEEGPEVVGFINHDSKARGYWKKLAKENIEWAINLTKPKRSA